ncbi:MAG: FliG C-terminal domain-containing protein [Bdellovibrionota bacterium]
MRIKSEDKIATSLRARGKIGGARSFCLPYFSSICNLLSALLVFRFFFTFILIVFYSSALSAFATSAPRIINPGGYEKLRFETNKDIDNRLHPILTRYCGSLCEIISIDTEILESFEDIEDLGFESAVDDANDNFYVDKATIKIQVDGRVDRNNRQRLEQILMNHLTSLGFKVSIDWVQVQLPQIGKSYLNIDRLKKSLEDKITRSLQGVIDRYCPQKCLLSKIAVDGRAITPDEADGLPTNEIVTNASLNSQMKIESIDIAVEIDSKLSEQERAKILNIMKAKTRYVSPVSIDLNTVDFPETHLEKEQKRLAQEDDPYGLEKLRRMLVMFRDLAGTKEVITNNSTSTKESKNNTSSSELSSTESSLEKSSWIEGIPNPVLIVGAVLFMILLLVLGLLKVNRANKDAHFMLQTARQHPNFMEDEYHGNNANEPKPTETFNKSLSGDLSLKLKIDVLKEELVDAFLNSPRVAKETFTRMLHEEGVEVTAKYVHIFGHLIVFELLGDPSLSRDLYELSEYYHKSEYDFDDEEIFNLLMALRTKVTANKIKVMAKKTMSQFDFLHTLDPTQIFNLVIDENAAVQSIVLTQLEHKRRRSVFDLFEGEEKVSLLKELCRAEAIPKEYLSNVAQALHKKVIAKPEFDTENLRSADILLDLLEKSSLHEQRALMANLQETNRDAARAIKLKLVTVEMLPYLKDGHLLELVLGLERADLLTFLAGADDHIRSLLLSNAPEELAESWLEDLETMSAFDEGRYRLVEMQILAKIRNLAANGVISLLDINDMIFAASQSVSDDAYIEEEIASNHLVA